MIDALADVRTPINRISGNVYRLARDAYKSGAPEPEELDSLRVELDSVREELHLIAELIPEVSPG